MRKMFDLEQLKHYLDTCINTTSDFTDCDDWGSPEYQRGQKDAYEEMLEAVKEIENECCR